MFLNGDAIPALGTRGQRVVDDSFYAAFNAYEGELDFVLPTDAYAEAWRVVLDTTPDDPELAFPVEPGGAEAADGLTRKAGDHLTVSGRSVVVLRSTSTA